METVERCLRRGWIVRRGFRGWRRGVDGDLEARCVLLSFAVAVCVSVVFPHLILQAEPSSCKVEVPSIVQILWSFAA